MLIFLFPAQLLEKNPKVRLADEEVTFYIFSAHRFFESVNWNKVLRGKDHVPQIPLLGMYLWAFAVTATTLSLNR